MPVISVRVNNNDACGIDLGYTECQVSTLKQRLAQKYNVPASSISISFSYSIGGISAVREDHEVLPTNERFFFVNANF
jgi:hypothetical protein